MTLPVMCCFSIPPTRCSSPGVPLSDKSKVAAGVLQLFLGGFGVGRFYTGHVGIAIAQLLTCRRLK